MKMLSELSVIIPITERHSGFSNLIAEYDRVLRTMADRVKYTVVIDGGFQEAADEVAQMARRDRRIQAVILNRSFGESTALTIGTEHSHGPWIMTLPAYYQVEPKSLVRLFQASKDADMIVARRWPRLDSKLNRTSNFLFNRIVQSMTGLPFHDLGCGVRLIRQRVLNEVQIYGDQHRFLPILAHQRGFRVREIDLPHAVEDRHLRVYRPGTYVRRLLDLLAVFFLVKFTRKPLRFFGSIGASLLGAGSCILLVTAYQKMFLSIALADRPLLLLGVLFVVLGVQLFAVGLLGELIIFVHARELKEYTIAETINVDIPENWQQAASGPN